MSSVMIYHNHLFGCQQAVSYLPYGDAVWLIQEGKKDKSGAEVLSVESQLVQTGRIRDGRVEILRGMGVGPMWLTRAK